MTVSNATISADVWTAVKAAIENASPIVTLSTSATKSAAVEAVYVNKRTTTPQIVVNPIQKEESEYKFGATRGRMFINITVDCYYKNTLGIDQLADQVEEAIANEDFGNMELVGISSDYAYTDPNEADFHLKSITFTFDKE